MRETKRPAKEICEDCGKLFETKNGFLCPDCRKKRLSRYAKERKLNRLGAEAYSQQQAELRREAGKK